jgi:hypothetical protein
MAAFSLLTNWKQNTVQTMETPNDGVSFLKANGLDDKEPEVTLATDGEQKNNYKGKHYNKAKVTCH